MDKCYVIVSKLNSLCLKTVPPYAIAKAIGISSKGPDALAVCRAHRGLPVGFLLLRYSV